MDSEAISISLKQTKGADLAVTIGKDRSVDDLKKEIQRCHTLDPTRMRLIYRGRVHSGRILKDSDVISEVGIGDKSVLHMVLTQPAPVPAAPAPAPNIPMQTGAGEMAGLLGALNSFGGMQQAQQAMDSLPDPSSLNPDLGMDPAAMQAMMQNPFFRQVMEQMLANDSFLDMALTSNPAMQGYMQQHPELAASMRDPMVRNMMRQQLQRMFSGSASGAMSGVPGSFPAPGQPQTPPPQPAPVQPAAPFAGFNPYMFMPPQPFVQPTVPQPPQQPQQPYFNPFLMNPYMYGGFNPAPAQPATSPREQYQTQLQQMRDMGFINDDANLNALQMCGGKVQLAVEYLLRLMG